LPRNSGRRPFATVEVIVDQRPVFDRRPLAFDASIAGIPESVNRDDRGSKDAVQGFMPRPRHRGAFSITNDQRPLIGCMSWKAGSRRGPAAP